MVRHAPVDVSTSVPVDRVLDGALDLWETRAEERRVVGDRTNWEGSWMIDVGRFNAYEVQSRTVENGDHWSGPPQMVDSIAEILRTRRGHKVLDVGAGLGGPARRLSARGCDVTALELLEPIAQAAQRRRTVGHRRPTYVVASADALPFRPASFDQVWALGVIAHVDNRETVCRNIARVLRPRGVVCFTEAFWNGTSRARFQDSAPWPWRCVTVERLSVELSVAGLGDISRLPWPGTPFASFADVSEDNLREDLLEGRLVPSLIVARPT
jgi:2-polyprenyl-3-methyl-5-hydroxy-6-metoxy-1,4-benzoquinol methylase